MTNTQNIGFPPGYVAPVVTTAPAFSSQAGMSAVAFRIGGPRS